MPAARAFRCLPSKARHRPLCLFQTAQESSFPVSGKSQRIVRIGSFFVNRFGFQNILNTQTRPDKCLFQKVGRPQPQMHGEVGNDKTDFSVGIQMFGASRKNAASIADSGSYNADSTAEVGLAGSQGGLQTIRSANPSGNKSVSRISTCFSKPKRAILARAQATALGLVSVPMTEGMPCFAKMAASTPEPVPISNAV